MSTIVAPMLSNSVLHCDHLSLKRKVDAMVPTHTDVFGTRHVKRAKTSLEGDVYSNRCASLKSSTDHDDSLFCVPNRSALVSAIAAVASSELSRLPDLPRDCIMKLPPPPTIAIGTPKPESHSTTEDKSEEEIDFYLDLDLDPASEDAEDVNDEMWASSLLFFISQTPEREKRERSPSPTVKPVEVVAPKADSPFTTKSAESKRSKKMKRRRGHFPKTTTDLLKRWLFEHLEHPYPTEEEKAVLAEDTGLTVKQINYWFTNSRRRFLKSRGE